MSRAITASNGGSYCGRAVHGVSNLSLEDMRQIEAHRAKDRPTPWAHLAIRFGVNELDLRQMFEAVNDDTPAPPVVHPPRLTPATRERLLRELWVEGLPRDKIGFRLGMDIHTVDRTRRRLGLAPRLREPKPKHRPYGASA